MNSFLSHIFENITQVNIINASLEPYNLLCVTPFNPKWTLLCFGQNHPIVCRASTPRTSSIYNSPSGPILTTAGANGKSPSNSRLQIQGSRSENEAFSWYTVTS
jgi:hypothetical protein